MAGDAMTAKEIKALVAEARKQAVELAEAARERDALRAELAAITRDAEAAAHHMHDLMAERDAMAEDTARLDWLDATTDSQFLKVHHDWFSRDDLRIAIDSARAASRKESRDAE